MDTYEVTELVRERGGYGSAEEARRAISEVLNVLSTRDLGGEAQNLAAQLPNGINDLLLGRKQKGEQFSAEEFIARIQNNLEITEDQAQGAARAVLSSVTDAVTEGKRTDFVNALPADFSGYTRWS